EHQDNANIHHQSFPEPVSEERDIYRRCVKHASYLPTHISTLRSGATSKGVGLASGGGLPKMKDEPYSIRSNGLKNGNASGDLSTVRRCGARTRLQTQSGY